MNRVIISGADGFVGSNTVEYFLMQDVEVLALDIGTEPKRLKPFKGLKYIQCDIADSKGILESISHNYYDTFIHFAWAGSAGPERANYDIQIQNTLNTVECMRTAKKIGCSRFVCAGSIMEYEVEAAIHEQGYYPALKNIYAICKYIAHCLCKAIAPTIDIELVWPMITNAYGVGELSPRFVNTTLRKIINNEPLQFTSANQNYDFVYITDIAEAFYLIAKNGKPHYKYMIGSGEAKPLKTFILEMLNACAPEVIPTFGDVPFTGTNLPLSIYDVSLTEHDTGFRAKTSFAEGTKRTLLWLKEQSIGGIDK